MLAKLSILLNLIDIFEILGVVIEVHYKMFREKLNMNWHTYSDHLKDMLHNMRKSEQLTDVTLVCDDKKQFKAHKVVLSACSSVFKLIIDNLPSKNSVVYLRGINHQELESILEFMYLGVATFYQDRLDKFLDVAKNLEVKEISQNVEFGAYDTHYDNDDTFINVNTINDEKLIIEAEEEDKKIEENLLRSVEQMSSDLPKKCQCPKCDKVFSTPTNMRTHYRSVHGERQFPCNYCNYQATRKHVLIEHIQFKHEGKKYSCNQCDVQETTNAKLRKHLLSKHKIE